LDQKPGHCKQTTHQARCFLCWAAERGDQRIWLAAWPACCLDQKPGHHKQTTHQVRFGFVGPNEGPQPPPWWVGCLLGEEACSPQAQHPPSQSLCFVKQKHVASSHLSQTFQLQQLKRHNPQYQLALGLRLASQCPNQVDAGEGGRLHREPPKCTKVEQDGDISPERQAPERKDGPGNSLEKSVKAPNHGHPRKLSVFERMSVSVDAKFFFIL